MTIARRLNHLQHACAALSIAAYTLAAEQPGLMLIVLAMLGLEFAFISRLSGTLLPRTLINAALAVATLLVIYELMRGGEGREFVSVIGRYLLWLQLIKLAEPKTPRNISQSLALTAMLAVGAVLTNVALIVGLLLLVYIPLFLASVVVFQIYDGHVHAYGMPDDAQPRFSPRRSTATTPTTTAPAAAIPAATDPMLAIDRAVASRWVPTRPHALAAGAELSRALLAIIAAASAAILAGSIVLFLIIPRGIGSSFLGSDAATPLNRSQVSGFTPDLQLGGSGVISESTAIALYIRFTRNNNILGSSQRPWYLRGYAMDRYNAETGRWIRSEASDSREHRMARAPWTPLDPEPQANDIVQEITIRNNRSEYLFSIFRPVHLEGPEGQRIRRAFIKPDGTIRLPRPANGIVSYTVRSRDSQPITTADLTAESPITPELDDTHDIETPLLLHEPAAPETTKAENQPSSTEAVVEPEPEPQPQPEPEPEPESESESEPALDEPLPAPLAPSGADDGADEPEDEPELFPRRRWQFQTGPIAELAASIAAQAGITLDAETPLTAAQIHRLASAIDEHLSARCSYTLDQPPLQPDEDPIEAFLFRTRLGHCEYFASASAALASAMRIPSRVVTGFHVSEWDASAKRYIVRESSAHAWAEVQAEPGQWLVIDPSAEDVRLLNRPPTGLVAGVRRLFDQLEFMWVSRVVTFDRSNQQQLIEMDFSSARAWLDNLNHCVARAIQRDREDEASEAEPSRLARIFAGTLTFSGLAAIGVVLGVLAWRLRARLRARRRRFAGATITDPAMQRRLRFYDDMLSKLDRIGRPKPAWQPPARYAQSLDPVSSAAVEQITALYYADRFGGRPLTDQQIRHAQQLVASLPTRPAAPSHA